MKIKSINLSWVIVTNFEKALKFYTEVVGLKVTELNEEFGWAELSGFEGGALLGIARQSSEPNKEISPITAGQNAVVTMTVEDITQSKAELEKKGVKTLGDIVECPGGVKLQSFIDLDGNHLQLVQIIS